MQDGVRLGVASLKINLFSSCELPPIDTGHHGPSQEKEHYGTFWKSTKSSTLQELIGVPQISNKEW